MAKVAATEQALADAQKQLETERVEVHVKVSALEDDLRTKTNALARAQEERDVAVAHTAELDTQVTALKSQRETLLDQANKLKIQRDSLNEMLSHHGIKIE